MRWSKKQIIAALAQLIVGITFIFSGLMKGIDPMGTAIKIEEYVAITGLHLPFWIYLGASVTLNVSEALLGVSLLMGWRRRITRWAAIILMCGMTLLTLYIYIFDPVADCGCFGDALVISNAATFWKNVVLLLFVIFLFRNPEAWYEWTSARMADGLIPATVVILVLFNVMNVKHEPIIDFRAYTIGSDLMELTTTGGTEGEYIYNFVYSKDGLERTFSMDELAEVDSTWTYVHDEIVVIEEAVRPPGADFVLVREDGSNAVEDLTHKDGKAIIIISQNLNDVDPSLLQRIIQNCNEPLLLAMGNTGEVWQNSEYAGFKQEFGEVLFLDKTTAKTVVRNNPGVLIIEGGKIVNKLTGKEFADRMTKSELRNNPYQIPTKGSRAKDLGYAFAGLVALAIAILVSRFFKNK